MVISGLAHIYDILEGQPVVPLRRAVRKIDAQMASEKLNHFLVISSAWGSKTVQTRRL